ncbi:hypothetical protein T09_4483 [Trichinella sp. T9]|nr:hypothetical protein T09_4483 [Trichinella sp. T9]
MDKQIDKCPTSMINFAPQTLCLRNELISLGAATTSTTYSTASATTAITTTVPCKPKERDGIIRIREGFAFPKGASKTALSGKSKNRQRLIKLSTSNNNKNN